MACRLTGAEPFWTNAGIFLIVPLGTKFSEILIEKSCIFIQENAYENNVWKMAAILYRPLCVDRIWCELLWIDTGDKQREW